MNHLYKQEYETAAFELQAASLAMGNYTVQIMSVNESVVVRYQAALQGFAMAKRKYLNIPNPTASDILSASY
jgi:hypothetical protein